MLLPTSSLLHKGVVLVPQLAQLNAPTAARGLLALVAALVFALASLSFAAAAAEGDAAASTTAGGGGALGEEGASALGEPESAGASETPTLPAARALL